MSRTHKLETHMLISVDSGEVEQEFPKLVVEYRHIPRYDGGYWEPSEPEHVEIGRVYVKIGETVNPLPEWMIEPMTEQLERICLAHWRGADDYAREQAADMRREDLLDEIREFGRPQAAE